MFHFLGQHTVCEVSLRTVADALGELDPNDLTVTPLDYLQPLLSEVKLSFESYQGCVRRFRRWFRDAVLRKAVDQSNNAFRIAKACAEAFHESIAPLFPLTAQLTNDQAQKQMQWMQQRRQMLEEQLISQPNDNPTLKTRYTNALLSMEYMVGLFSGQWLQNLIPDGCPVGYVGSRLQQLIQDLVMSEFDGHQTLQVYNTDSGQQLPSDTTVLMFLMCIYLKVPGWQLHLFHAEVPKVRNGPLHFMSVDPLADSTYSAFLTSVPSQRGSGSNGFILRHKRWLINTSESVMTLMLDGKLRANFGGISGFFEAMTVYLAYHRLNFSNIGGIPFDTMPGLDWVFEEQASQG